MQETADPSGTEAGHSSLSRSSRELLKGRSHVLMRSRSC
nr:MAG TPA: hypothetical protein [Caudoviricetes sp.]